MKKRRATVIIWVLAVLLLISGLISAFSLRSYIHQRKLFINDVYFRITAVEACMRDFDAGNAEAVGRIAEELAILDNTCDIQSKYTNGAFYYENRGRFLRMRDALLAGEYSESDVKSLHAFLIAALEEMSDKSGAAENENLTYKQLNAIFADFFSKVDALQG